MPRTLQWLLLAALGGWALLDSPRRAQWVLGTLALALGLGGALYHRAHGVVAEWRGGFWLTCSPEGTEDQEAIIRDSFPRLPARDAAALAGLLHEKRIRCRPGAGLEVERTVPTGPGVACQLEALELPAAIELVSRVYRHDPQLIGRIYRAEWGILRGTRSPALARRIEEHPFVHGLVDFPRAC